MSRARVIRDTLRIAVAITIGAGLVATARRISLRDLSNVLGSANLPLLAIAVPILLGLNLVLRAARFHALLPKAPFGEVMASVLVSQAANNVLPLRAGDIMRTRDFVIRGHPLSRVVSAQVTEKSVELAGLLAWAAPLASRGPLRHHAGSALALFVVALVAPTAWLLWRMRDSEDAVAFAARARRGITDLFCALLWSCAADGLEVVLIYVCLLALHIGGGWVASMAVLAAINVAIALPAAPGNLGTFEAGAAFGLVLSGVPADRAVAFALLYRVVQWGPVTLAGGLVAWVRRRHLHRASPSGIGNQRCDALV